MYVSVTLPVHEKPFVSGWYLSKFHVVEDKVVHVQPVCACQVVDVPSEKGPGMPSAISIQKMRWCHGVPKEERSAAVNKEQLDSYWHGARTLPPAVKREPVAAPRVRQEPEPYATTDPFDPSEPV